MKEFCSDKSVHCRMLGLLGINLVYLPPVCASKVDAFQNVGLLIIIFFIR